MQSESRLFRRLKPLCLRPHLPLGVALLGMLLTSPSLTQGFQVDDYTHRYVILGHKDFGAASKRPIMDLFAFIQNSKHRPVMEKVMRDQAPWWSFKGLRLAFWRPLTSATHWLDYKLWPSSPFLMHLQNLLWFGFLLWLLALYYRRIFQGAWLAGFAALFYAMHHVFGLPVAWIANRNGLIATAFGVLCLLWFDRWRREGWTPGLPLGLLALTAGLLSAEAAIATCAYLFAYVCFLDPAPWRKRLLALVPFGVLVVAWRIVYKALGFQTYGSGFYIDPLSEISRFFFAVLERGPLLLLGQWLFPPVTPYPLLPLGVQRGMWIWAALVLVGLIVLLWPLRHDKVARFWGTGMLLSVIPICATFPNDRLLFFVAIGGMGLLAQSIGGFWERASWLPDSSAWLRFARIAIAVLLGVHLFLSPLLLPLTTFQMAFFDAFSDRAASSIKVDASNAEQTFVIVNSFNSFADFTISLRKMMQGKPFPRRLRTLAPGHAPTTVTRKDAHTLVIRPRDGYILAFDQLFRDPSIPLKVGTTRTLTNFVVTITRATPEGRPLEASFRFRWPLEDKRMHFYEAGQKGAYKPFVFPKVGQSRTLPPAVPF